MKRIFLTMKKFIFTLIPAFFLCGCTISSKEDAQTNIKLVDLKNVTVNDPFWTPKLKQWATITVNDVFDKFEGKHFHDEQERHRNNTFNNFDDVAKGRKLTGHHAGLPWFDGLVYETIRGAADLLVQFPDRQLEARIDGYIDRIDAAQQIDPDGYINTWTDLIEPYYRWGDNGGLLRWQHDVYNAGMLIEAGVHYYRATGKTKLLEVATKFANYMCRLMGPAPKENIVPAHSGPEEAMLKLYRLFKNNPEIKSKISVPVQTEAYFKLATFWIENRGNHCGYPLWLAWGNHDAEKWIRDVKYKDPAFGKNARPTWGDYAQDSISIFQQKTIEGHAVRATLLATGIAAAALENNSPKYVSTAKNLWENMTGKRMFVTGGVGAVHHDEKFGPDYFLPTDAYLETCAAVGVGFFSQRMNELTADAQYMDEFERALYNNVLTGISLSGDRYTYQNPLNAHRHERWQWHPCPCCPPMFLKIMAAMPGFIYAYGNHQIFVNLFVGSQAHITLNSKNRIEIHQETRYPYQGKVSLNINPEKETLFSLHVRIPGWAQGMENPYSLYTSDLSELPTIAVNNESIPFETVNGYAVINRTWQKGDKVELVLPVQPRRIKANHQVKQLEGLVAIASGPMIYCIEEYDNENLDQIKINKSEPLTCLFDDTILHGINIIEQKNGGKFRAVPYFAIGNRKPGCGYKVWIPEN